MKILHINVEGKTATYIKRDGAIVCGNDDYRIAFTFDEEWAQYPNKMARFIWGGKYYDIMVEGDEAAVPGIHFANEVTVGLYVEGQIRTTTAAVIPCVPSVLSHDVPAQPNADEGYTVEAKKAAAEAVVAAGRAERANTSATAAQEEATAAAATAGDHAGEAAASAEEAATSATEATAKAADANNACACASASAAAAANSANEAKSAATSAKDVTLAHVTALTALNKRVTNLEGRIQPDPFAVNEERTDIVYVPPMALRYAEVNAIGGLTSRKAGPSSDLEVNLFDSSKIASTTRTSGDGTTMEVSPNDRGGFDARFTAFTYTIGVLHPSVDPSRDLCVRDVCDAREGATYTLSIRVDPAGESSIPLGGLLSGVIARPGESVTFTMTSDILDGPIIVGVDPATQQVINGVKEVSASFTEIMLTETPYAVPYVPYGVRGAWLDTSEAQAIVSKRLDGSELARLAVPAEVQALDGYGWGFRGFNTDLFNSIEWDPETGRPSFVKRVGRVTFDGSENWYNGSTENGFYVSASVSNAYRSGPLLSNKFEYGWPESIGVPCAYFAVDAFVVFPGTDATTLDAWKAKLAEWAAAGDPLTVYYQLAEPAVLDISGIMTSDNFIEVEPDGTINVEYKGLDPIPTRITFQMT